MKNTLIALALATAGAAALAQATPVGLWKTIDDDGKTEKSSVRITETAGLVSGKIEKIADSGKAADVCDKCSDERKDKPIVGMTIIRNAKKGDDGVWEPVGLGASKRNLAPARTVFAGFAGP